MKLERIRQKSSSSSMAKNAQEFCNWLYKKLYIHKVITINVHTTVVNGFTVTLLLRHFILLADIFYGVLYCASDLSQINKDSENVIHVV